jgi:hypothetical protein
LPENYLLAVRLSLSEGSLLAEFAGTPYLRGNDDPQKKVTPNTFDLSVDFHSQLHELKNAR